jgi:Secretion system C-terminal sorting domain
MNLKITLLVVLASFSTAFSQNLNFTNKPDKLIPRGGSASSKDQSNDIMYVVNGYSTDQQVTSEIEAFNFYEDLWYLYTPSIPTIAKKYPNMEIMGNTMYIFNGLTSTGINNKLEQLNLDSGVLTVNTILNPDPVYSGGSSVWGDYIVSFGGCSNQFNAQYSKKLYKIAPWGEWTALADMPVGLETKGEVVYDSSFNSKLYVFGGYKETNATTEKFDNASVGDNIAFPDWINVTEAGTKVYKGRLFNSNRYAEISAFDSNVANQQSSNISWLITNSITAMGSDQIFLNFDTKDGFNNGATLQAYLITNWTGDITTSTKTLLNSNIASGTTAGFATNFTGSGNIPLSGDLSNFRIGFKYVGGYAPTPKTTTYQIDNVRVYKSTISNNIYIYDFASNSWTTSNTTLPISLSAYAVAKQGLYDTKLYITGDYSNQTFAGVYDTTNDTFTSLTQTNMIGRRHHASEIWQDNLFIFGGNTTSSIASSLASTQSADLPTLASETFVSTTELKMYPNPATDVLHFENEQKNISVYTIDGKEIKVEQPNKTLDISKLTKGIYLVVAEDQNGKISQSKLIKK